MAEAPTQRKKILLIEDVEFLRHVFMKPLMGEGYDVIGVGSAEEGLDRLKDQAPDLIILDLYLPQMNGFDFLKLVKADPARAGTPVLILSGLEEKEDIRKGLELGAQEFVVKANLSPYDLVTKVRRMLAAKPKAPGTPE